LRIAARFLLAPLAAAALAAQQAGAVTPSPLCPGAKLRPSATGVQALDEATLCLIDEQRAARGLRPLRANRELQAVASGQLKCMVQANAFADDCPAGETPLARIAATPYGRHAAALSVGQDLGWGTGADVTPAAMVRAWMRSRPHREIILSGTFTDAGAGVSATVPRGLGAGEPAATYAVEFATRVR
jgi:uncharacterized protein YkwD